MANAGSVVIKINGDDSGYKKTLNGLGKATSAAIKGLTVAAGAFSAVWSAAGVTSVKYNAEIEQLETSFKVMTGSAEKAASIIERLRKLGATTQFATKDLAATTQLLMQYGLGADEAIDRMSMLGDISQGNAEKMTRIATAYGQMSSAGKVNLEDVKQMIEAGYNPLLEISERTGESMASLYDRISKGKLSVDELTQSMRAATSEGGKFFGSMEAQSQTVSGLLSSLKDELQTLGGDVFEPISEALRSKVLPEAIRVVQEMQNAYGKGGFDGLVDALTAEIPKLLNAASAALEKLAAKLKAKLPGIIKKLISALPDVLASLGDSILPTLVDTIFNVISVAVEEIVGRLPELVPVILRGVLNLVKSVATGIWNVVSGLFDGLETAMKKMGLLSLSPMEAFEQAWENADTSQIKEIDVSVGVNITPEEYETKIETALSEVRETLENIPGLTDDQRNAIETAIINGTGIDLIEETLNNLDLPDGKADEIVDTIKAASEKIDSALLELGLTEDQADYIKQVKADGGDVQAALEAYGVDPEAAKDTAETIDNATNEISNAAAEAGIDPTVIESLEKSALTDKDALVAALLLLKVDPSEIQTITDNYDELAGSLTASAKSIFNQIYEEYTNGVAETPEDIDKAKEAVKKLFKTAYDQVDEWKEEAIEELEKSGLTGDALASAVLDVEEQADELISELNRMEAEAMTWTEENANKSTAFVKGNLHVLDEIVSELSDVSAKIDTLTGKAFSVAKQRRTLVKAGAVTDVTSQVQAFQITSQELAQSITDAETQASAALEEAVEKFAGDAEGYAKREKEIIDEMNRKKEIAYAKYNSENAQIIAGIVKASPDLSAAFESYNAEQQAVDMVTKLQQGLANAVNDAAMGKELISADALIENLTAEGVDMSVIAEKLGISSEELYTQIANALKSGDGDTVLNAALVEYTDGVSADLATALANAGIDATAIPAIKKAIEDGYLKAAGDVDWTSMETILTTMASTAVTNAATELEGSKESINAAASTAVSDVPATMDKSAESETSGKNTGQGYATGLASKRQAVVTATAMLANAAKNTWDRIMDINSPSKVAKRGGSFVGQGYALGIESEADNVRRATEKIANASLGALDGIGGRISVSQQINAGGMASAFQSMLAGMNLATDNGQPVQLFINGRLVAETIKRDIAATQAGYNMDLAKGVGKA